MTEQITVAEAIWLDQLAWFEDSPDAGDPACICSYCGNIIGAQELCFRLHNRAEGLEARLCDNCLRQLDLVLG